MEQNITITTPDQSGFGSDDSEVVLHISQSSNFTGASLSDGLMTYLEHSFWGYYLSAKMRLVYSNAPVDWT